MESKESINPNRNFFYIFCFFMFGFCGAIPWSTILSTMDFYIINYHEYNVVFSILGFHRFFELLMKDILRRINPFLAVKFLEKEEELFKFLDNKLNADEIKTIENAETIKRFKQAFKHYDKTSEIYLEHLKDYEFLTTKESYETLEMLAEWRNRIMHNGTTLPNLFAFEYLFF